MASSQRPTVQIGDVIRVHVPDLGPDLWRVDDVLQHRDGWGYFLRISQRRDGAKVCRVIAPIGYQIITSMEDFGQ